MNTREQWVKAAAELETAKMELSEAYKQPKIGHPENQLRLQKAVALYSAAIIKEHKHANPIIGRTSRPGRDGFSVGRRGRMA